MRFMRSLRPMSREEKMEKNKGRREKGKTTTIPMISGRATALRASPPLNPSPVPLL